MLEPLAGDLEVIPASEVIPMSADPGSSVRRMKDSSLVRAAEAVRDGKASAMISAGNTGATMASALLRMGRIKGVARPGHRHADPGARAAARRSSSTPAPTPSARPTGCCSSPRWAPCSPAPATASSEPRVGLLSIGEEASKGTPLVKETHALLAASEALEAAGGTFIGNVEGRDVMTPDVDVVVTDGFTGNVVLKTLEGGMRTLVDAIFGAFGTSPETQAASEVLIPALLPLYAPSTPTTPAAPCSSASTGSASSATARRRPPPSSTRCGWPRSSTTPGSSTASAPPSPRRAPAVTRRPGVAGRDVDRRRATHRGHRRRPGGGHQSSVGVVGLAEPGQPQAPDDVGEREDVGERAHRRRS